MLPCLSENTLSDLLEGHLPADTLAEVTHHLDQCAGCRTLVASLVSSFRPPDEFEEYRLLGPLGQGETGDVYAASDTRLDRTVAIKFLRGIVLDPKDPRRERFAIEARAVARLRHPNVVSIYRAGEVDGRPYLVSEFIEGHGLDRHPKPVAAGEALRWGIDLADALAAAHRQGVLHRDIKPANVMVTPAGEVRLLDFGLAKLADALPRARPPAPVLPGSAASSPALTRTGSLLGTPLYMAPEIWLGRPASVQSDLYCLGALLYELCAGRPPHTADTTEALRRAVLLHEAPPLHRVAPAIDPGLARIVARCLLRDPAARFASAQEMLGGLRLCERSFERPGTRRRSRLWGAALGVPLLLLGAAIGHRVLSTEKHPPAAARHEVRRALAVLEFAGPAAGPPQQPEHRWLARALQERLAQELSLGGDLRVVPVDLLARMCDDLSLPAADRLDDEALRRVRGYTGADVVVVGAYGVEAGGDLRLRYRVQDTRTGATRFQSAESGAEQDLSVIVTRAGARLRRQLGLSPASAAERLSLRAWLPEEVRGARLLALAEERIFAHDFSRARDLLLEAAVASPGSALVHHTLASVWEPLGAIEKRRQETRLAMALGAGLRDEERLSVEAADHIAFGRFHQATERYRTLMEQHPDVLEYGLTLAAYQLADERTEEGLVTLEGLRRLPPPLGDDPRIDLETESMYRVLGDYAAAQKAARRSVTEAQARGARHLAAQARANEGWTLLSLGDSGAAGAAFEEAIPVLRALGSVEDVAWALGGLVSVRVRQGELAQAVRVSTEELQLLRQSKNRPVLLWGLYASSQPLARSGNLAQAQARVEEALALCRDGEVRDCLSEGHRQLGDIYLLSGRVDEALREFAASLPRRSDGADRVEFALATLSLGRGLLLRGDLDGARKRCESALPLLEQAGIRRYGAHAKAALATLSLSEGRLPEAEAQARGAIADYQKDGAWADLALAQATLAQVFLARGVPDEAARESAAAMARASHSENLPSRLGVVLVAAQVRAQTSGARKIEDLAGARETLAGVAAEARRAGLLPMEYEARLALLHTDLARAGPARDPNSGPARAATTRLRVLIQEARKSGLGLIASNAEALLRAHIARAKRVTDAPSSLAEVSVKSGRDFGCEPRHN